MREASEDDVFLKVLVTLNEAQSRWYVGREALARGRGGISAMERLTGMSRPAILKGIRELHMKGPLEVDRVRRPGGGRKRVEHDDPGFETDGKKVTEFRAGKLPEVEYVEGCL